MQKNKLMPDSEVKKNIYENFKFLLTLGYSFEEKVVPCEYNPKDSRQYIYINKFVNIKIRFYEGLDGASTSLISIFKNNENKSFSFDEYLKMKSEESDDDLYDYINSIELAKKPPQEYISTVARLFKNAVDSELKDVLNGETWIDVPEDWSIAGR